VSGRCSRRSRGRNGNKPDPPIHDDFCTITDENQLVRHKFTATNPNQLQLTNITKHKTTKQKLYLYTIKDVFSSNILDDSIDARMKSRSSRRAPNNAATMRGNITDCIVQRDHGPQFQSRKFLRTLNPSPPDPIDGPDRFMRQQPGHGERLRTTAEKRPQPPPLNHP
jgi:putative transposase